MLIILIDIAALLLVGLILYVCAVITGFIAPPHFLAADIESYDPDDEEYEDGDDEDDEEYDPDDDDEGENEEEYEFPSTEYGPETFEYSTMTLRLTKPHLFEDDWFRKSYDDYSKHAVRHAEEEDAHQREMHIGRYRLAA